MTNKTEYQPRGSDRRQNDRRQANLPYAGPDRRVADRRSGIERRSRPQD